MASDTHIPATDLQVAVSRDRQMNQTATKIHQEIANHDGSGLRQTVGQIGNADMQSALTNYELLYGQPLAKAVAADKSLPQEAKVYVKERIDQQDRPPSPAERQKWMADTMDAMKQSKITGLLASDQVRLAEEQLLVQNALYSKQLADQFSSVFHGKDTDGKVQAAAQYLGSTEGQLRKTLTDYSPAEVKALQEYSITHSRVPGRGVLNELADDKALSPDTRKFVVELLAKTQGS